MSRAVVAAAVAGALFGAGLALSGMTARVGYSASSMWPVILIRR